MSKRVEFFFDFGSPTAYLAWTQLPGIAMEARAEIVWRPMLLGGVFKATGNQSPVLIEPKGKWMFDDMARWARRYGVKLEMNPWFIINTLTLMRGAAGLQMRESGRFLKYVDVMYRAMWETPVNLGDPAVKQRLIDNTDEAVRRGVFGAPTMFVGDAMFFGQDRLEFVKDALRVA